MKWLIIFPDPWIAYSPSCLNFITMIEEQGDTYVLFSFNDGSFDNSHLQINKYDIIIKDSFMVKIMKKIKLFKYFKIIKFYITIKSKKINDYDKVIGFDDVGYFIARMFDKNAIYYSLEISKSFLNYVIFKFLNVKLLIIQSEERMRYLVNGNKMVDTVYIQNSAIYNEFEVLNKTYNNKLVYFGNIIPSHGVDECIKVLRLLKEEILVIKGLAQSDTRYINQLKEKYHDLISANRLFFDLTYIEKDKVSEYLSQFSIGFCFYDLKFKNTRNFNYLSSPSGKMFNYFNSCTPVIGIDFVGLHPIKKFNAGVLIENYNEREVLNAIHKIKENYNYYVSNTKIAAIYYDYRKMFYDAKAKIYGS